MAGADAGRIAWLVETLGLAPHPEGGHYRRVFASDATVLPGDGRPARPALTTIYYLLAAGECSQWHRVASDEAWYHLEGAVLELRERAEADAPVEVHRLGPLDAGAKPLHVVARRRWQAARSCGAYTLVACAVGPGFDFADFELLSARPAG